MSLCNAMIIVRILNVEKYKVVIICHDFTLFLCRIFLNQQIQCSFFFFTKENSLAAFSRKKANAEKKQEKKKAFQHQDSESTADVYLFALGDFAVMPWKLNKRNWESCRSEAHMLSLEFRHLVIVLSVMFSVSTLGEISVQCFDLKTTSPPTCRHQHQHTRLSSQQNVCRLLTFTGQGWIYPKPFLPRQKM